MSSRKLQVVVDGEPLADDAARALWIRFSQWMDANVGDLAGFARSEGFASVRPEMLGGGPVLMASRSAPQVPYAAVSARSEPAALRRGRGGPPGQSRSAAPRAARLPENSGRGKSRKR
jgi:hypothetical protein